MRIDQSKYMIYYKIESIKLLFINCLYYDQSFQYNTLMYPRGSTINDIVLTYHGADSNVFVNQVDGNTTFHDVCPRADYVEIKS